MPIDRRKFLKLGGLAAVASKADHTLRIANQRGLLLFHCHSQLHMDVGFMALFECA